MLESFANWFLNTFIRLPENLKYIVLPIITLIMLISLAKGYKKTKGDMKKLKDFAFGPFILAAASFVYLGMVTMLG